MVFLCLYVVVIVCEPAVRVEVGSVLGPNRSLIDASDNRNSANRSAECSGLTPSLLSSKNNIEGTIPAQWCFSRSLGLGAS